jgi:hypothetical protein
MILKNHPPCFINRLGICNIGNHESKNTWKKSTRTATFRQKTMLRQDVAEYLHDTVGPGKAKEFTLGRVVRRNGHG